MAKSGKTKVKGKLPKKIAGVKLDKKLRKTGDRLIAVAASPVGRELLTTGFALVAGAIGAAAEKEHLRRNAVRKPTPSPTSPPRAANAAEPEPQAPSAPFAGKDPHEIGVALGKIAEAALTGLFAARKR